MNNTVLFKDERSEKVKAICRQYKLEGCRETCPLSEPCTMKANDTRDKFIARMNAAAAEQVKPSIADSIFDQAVAITQQYAAAVRGE
jgi:hypothetical protein